MMENAVYTAIAALTGAAVGLFLTYIFSILPESWLQDYDYDVNSPDFRLAKRMKTVPHGLLAALCCAVLYGVHVWFFMTSGGLRPIHSVVFALSVPVIMIVVMSDRLNRIIPDQCPIFLLIMGAIALAGDYIEGSIWFSEQAAWFAPILNRVIALIVGGGFLFLIAFLSETFLGREGMGQGDIKLLGAAGFLVGCYGLVILVYVAVFAALFFAIPLLIRKNIRIRKEKAEIKNSPDPVAKRREIAQRKAKIHYADDPDYLAFGPFLAIGAGVFLCLEKFFFDYFESFIKLLGVYF